MDAFAESGKIGGIMTDIYAKVFAIILIVTLVEIVVITMSFTIGIVVDLIRKIWGEW